MLSSYPLEGKGSLPVFPSRSFNEVSNLQDDSSNKASVYFISKCTADGSRNIISANQKKLVEEGGSNAAPLRVQALFDAAMVFGTGKCPDSNKRQYTFARCLDTIHLNNSSFYHGCHVAIL